MRGADPALLIPRDTESIQPRHRVRPETESDNDCIGINNKGGILIRFNLTAAAVVRIT